MADQDETDDAGAGSTEPGAEAAPADESSREEASREKSEAMERDISRLFALMERMTQAPAEKPGESGMLQQLITRIERLEGQLKQGRATN